MNSNQSASLYEVRRKIHPRAVTGKFATWRWSCVWLTQLIFYGLCWLNWNDRQAILFHLTERKFYIFGLVLWPQDIFYFALLLVIAALSLFLFTAIAGRVWCGYACPQTVYTEIFMWIERKIEGKHKERIKLDNAPLSAHKLTLRISKHALWGLISLWTGFSFVGYFIPIQMLIQEIIHWKLSSSEIFWILFYSAATWANAGFLREQVCKYMCPYARFQGVMFDPHTLTVTYDKERGEPRGKPQSKNGTGSCIDCNICVQVCPTGIDIRNGLQHECIGCSACIDACDQVMDKIGSPRGLIRYATQYAMAQHSSHSNKEEIRQHILRPRVIAYGIILLATIIITGTALTLRVPLKVDVMRDRRALAQALENGTTENVYRLQIMNIAEHARRFTLAASGLTGIEVASQRSINIAALGTESIPLRLRAPSAGQRGAHKIYIEVQATDNPAVKVHEKASFLVR